MSSYFQDYATVLTFLFMGFVLMSIFLGLAKVFKPNNPTEEKLSTYECGVDPVGEGWSQTYVRYYIFGLLFVIFDVEAIFIFPWAARLEVYDLFGLVEMAIFIFILALGLLYAWRKRLLRWG